MIDEYLDGLFNRLTGTGRAGRRSLAEAEDHLRSAAEEGVVRGLSPQEAEREAVRRFGDASQIAGSIQRAHGGPAAVLSGLWLLAGLSVIVYSVGRLFKAGELATQMNRHPEASAALSHLLWTGLGIASLGLAILLGRWFARRQAGLAAAGRWFPLYTFGLLTAGAVVIVFAPPMMGMPLWAFGDPGPLPGLHTSVHTGAAALLAAIAVAITGVARLGRRT